MNFTFTTKYNKETMIALAKALRKTLRQKRGKRSRMFGVLIALAGVWLMLKDGFVVSLGSVATILAVTLAGVVFFREKLTRRQWLALGAILAALVLLNI